MNNLISTIEILFKIIGFIIAISFMVSFIYNYFYFWALSIDLSNIPITTVDIVNSVLVLIAPMGAFVVLYFSGALMVATEPKEEKHSKLSISGAWFRYAIYILAALLFLRLVILGQLQTSEDIAFVAALISFILLNKAFSSSYIKEDISKTYRFPIISIIVLFIYSASCGYDNATEQVQQTNSSNILYSDSLHKQAYTIIRTIDKGMLLKEKGNNSELILLLPDNKEILIPYKNRFYHGLLNKAYINNKKIN